MVVGMKLFTISGPTDQFDAMVYLAIGDSEFQPEHAMALMQDIRGVTPFPYKNPYTALLQQGNDLLAQLDLSADEHSYDRSSVSPEEAAQTLASLAQRVQALNQEIEGAKLELENIAHLSEELGNLQGVRARLETLRTMRFARFRFGHMPKESYDSAKEMLDARADLFFIPTRTAGGQVFGVYFTTLQAHDHVDRLFNSMHFVRLLIDEHAFGSAEDALAALQAREARAHDALARAQEALERLRREEGDALITLVSCLQQQNDTYDLRRFAAQSHDNFYLTGWVPEDCAAEIKAKLDQLPQVSCVVDDAEDLPLTPPTKLKNNALGRIFEPFVAMFGLPKYGGNDPSFFMALTYTLLFGCMFGDLGQGLGLALIGFIISKKTGNWLGEIITCCGLSASLFGCIYGSVFGFEDLLPGFKVMEGGNIMLTLILALALGVLTLLVVMSKNILAGFRAKDYKRALFGANGIAGVVFYVYAVLLIADLLLQTGLPVRAPICLLLFLLLPLLSILCAEPLANALSGQRPLLHESVGSFLAVGFFELFETVLSFLTNSLSFLRVGAYAIIHAGMMHVVFMLAGEPLNPLVLLIGNVFVMGFEGLLVGIQVLRLEFYEMFGRFYEAGGRAYTGSPLKKVR